MKNGLKRLAALMVLAAVLAPYAGAVTISGNLKSVMYAYNGSSQIYAHYITRSKGNTNTIMLDYFHITSDGSAALTKTPDKAFILEQQNDGKRVLAYVSNHWSRSAARNAMAKRSTVAAQLANWVLQYGLDGLDVDIENLTEVDKANFTDFIRILRALLPKNAILTIAAAPNPKGWTTGWQGMYDYKKLGEYADHILLMTYDEHFDGDDIAGPVGSFGFCEKSIIEALKYIPKSKLLLGMPFYGRYWAAYSAGGVSKGKAFTLNDVDVILNHYTNSAWYDETNHCARALVSVKSDDPGIDLWGGKKMTAGTYDIWYENERSMETRMALVRKYDLAGVGCWALGQEPERFWSSFYSWLYSSPFGDITGHWAESEILALYEKGLVKGVGTYQFAPGKNITRAEMITLMMKLLEIDEIPGFEDHPELGKHWSRGFFAAAVSLGIVQGNGGKYKPNEPVTRAEMALLCYKAAHIPNTIDFSQMLYNDVTTDHWANNAIIALSVYNVIKGAPDGNFNPSKSATRAEAAAIIYRMLSIERVDYNSPQNLRITPVEPR